MNVVFIVFNRPEVTQRVFDRIAAARPEKLLLISDGPRTDRCADAPKVALVREIVSKVDWPCEVYRNFAEVNFGCRKRVSSGLDWAFSIVEEAIILEDDCLPDTSFFMFCQSLLERYRTDERVMQIGGANFQNGIRRSAESYYFSKYPHVWGWATWRRAWRHYDLEMKRWPDLSSSGWLGKLCPSEREQMFWKSVYDKVYCDNIDTWDYQWVFACWVCGGFSIVPALNMVENLGFGQDATHTVVTNNRCRSLKACALSSPIQHPQEIKPNIIADQYTFNEHISPCDSLLVKFKSTFLNKHYYGIYIRKIPVIGTLWSRWRAIL